MAGWAAAAQAVTDIGKTSAAVYQQQWAQKRAERAFKHRYRWTMRDMRKAGLNPILAHGGSPGVAATAQPVAIQGGNTIGADIRAARREPEELRLLKERREQQYHQKHTTGLQGNVFEDQARVARAQVLHVRAQTEIAQANARSARADALMKEAQVHSALAVGRFDQSLAGQTAAQWNRLLNQAIPVKGVGALMDLRRKPPGRQPMIRKTTRGRGGPSTTEYFYGE